MLKTLLETPAEYLKGIGPQRALWLRAEYGIKNYEDLLSFYPRRYIDRSRFYRISELSAAQAEVQVTGRITFAEMVHRNKRKRLVAQLEDQSGKIDLIWFQKADIIERWLPRDLPVVVFGRLSFFQGHPQMTHPEIEPLEHYHSCTPMPLQPVWTISELLQKKGIHQSFFIKTFRELLRLFKGRIHEIFPENIMINCGLISREEAFYQIYFPESLGKLSKAQYRLKFEELFFLQLALLMRRYHHKKIHSGYPFTNVGSYLQRFYRECLPFSLTQAQKRVLKEIRHDLGQNVQMNRLLQGDVGSGKTLVALMAMLIALDNGFQASLMAPTEILAAQHYQMLSGLLSPLGIIVAFLTGSTSRTDRRQLHYGLREGRILILVGTHALIEDEVVFKNLGLAVIDEQHRFGVIQRARLWKKNERPPHILLMTATPIPRTLSMTLYGDLDVSIIDELPPGRKAIKTLHRYEHARLEVFGFIRDQIAHGRQVYIVYPLIEESEKVDYKNLMEGYESISRAFPLPEYRIGILHGKMSSVEKSAEMNRFIKGETQIMVSTTVIEVGVDVQNATVMLIENAELFGLSQLHQLRGRVGRGARQSYCLLMSDEKISNEARARIEVICRSNNGFEIAEEDLRLRGPGDLMGTKQSGLLDLRIANIFKDSCVLGKAREQVMILTREDPELLASNHHKILEMFQKKYREKLSWGKIG
ncbi:ATP-dependent DNA helicase RecG [Bacteroidetes bacterium endosymbiont of Geopemphigus sp.]|uniref:ATP-dependent DNA helicase RecG n=1 Tax=Bacteroidetes bacterium endosymbiont of Geopemphigus sp. TaxID=2047937 RepID=UPI000CD0A65D|nr:ATP-dependent DNA helicase RecG [Bacteroidetes bacterium endosymbiont of Geopemphigus sp.]